MKATISKNKCEEKQCEKKQYEKKEREIWLDNVKVLACVLVVLGHFYQSMVKSEILPDNASYHCFNQIIYYFHVPLFFIASGYLYQKLSKINSLASWCTNTVKKILALLVPYFTFSILTWMMKMVAGNLVNDAPKNLFTTLFCVPLSPYWFLYILFFIFLVTPTFKNTKAAMAGITIAVLLKIVTIIGLGDGNSLPYIVAKLFENEIWFVAGMSLHMVNFNKKISDDSKKYIVISATAVVLFAILSILRYVENLSFPGIDFAFGIMWCTSIIVLFCAIFSRKGQTRIFGFLAKYTMPIFLLHTIFAATIRSFLIKMGLTNDVIHILLGITISFIGPILAAEIMKKIKILEFLMYPLKYIKVK